MELCTTSTRASSSPALQPNRVVTSGSHFRSKHSVALKTRTHFLGVVSRTSTLLRATSDESSSESSKISGDRTDGVATIEDVPSVDNDVALDNVAPVRQSLYDESTQPEPAKGESSSDGQTAQSFEEFLESLNLKMDSEDSYYTIFLYGGGALIAVWLLSAVVGAIDSIPVFPKLMEVVGLGYSLWFTTRYLLFKRNREELSAKIEELKNEVLGPDNN